MKRAPSLADIEAAELAVVRARRDARAALGRLNHAVRTSIARPSSLALVAAVAGALGYLAGRPIRRAPQSSSPAEGGVAKTSAAALLLGFASRYLMRRLPFMLQQFWATVPVRSGKAGP